ncbi:MAG TPA: DUF5658 family protein [Candidatus Aminicenantes bacterium]|nr:DUF5658 family protein [Candidatus Aminicenantes bacterium]HRY64233.1 DUF5658 family protein [Candidatus Aminicenantes bacterium]HRZ71146.1 DUF5658 family protein [Candidatus Aminicenantes bacterium]
MKAKIAIVVIAASLVAAAPVRAAAVSEATWDLIVPTTLIPSTLALPTPLAAPLPAVLEVLTVEPPAPLPAQMGLTPRLPSLQRNYRPGKAFFEANLIIMLGLNVADYVSTREALKYPGLTETNPLMKPFVNSPAAFAAIKFGTTALSYVSMKFLFKRNRTMAWIMTTATNALLSYVVANNYRQIQMAKAR